MERGSLSSSTSHFVGIRVVLFSHRGTAISGDSAFVVRPANLDLDALTEPEWVRFEEDDLDDQDAGIRRSARVGGSGLSGDHDSGNLLDLAAPTLPTIAFGGDRDRGVGTDSGDVELVHLGLDTKPGQVNDRNQGSGGANRLAGIRVTRDDDAIDGGQNPVLGGFGLEAIHGCAPRRVGPARS